MAATALIAAGVDVKTTQVRMGHSSPHVTLALYARATTVADRAAAEAAGERYRPRDGRAMDDSQPGEETGGEPHERGSDLHVLPWAVRDSNPRPQPCEGCALTS